MFKHSSIEVNPYKPGFELDACHFTQLRIYTAKRVNEELEVAKEDYIISNLRAHKGQRILLPKIVESFAKDSGLCLEDLEDIVECLRPDRRINDIQQRQRKKSWKSIGWIPHNFTLVSRRGRWWVC